MNAKAARVTDTNSLNEEDKAFFENMTPPVGEYWNASDENIAACERICSKAFDANFVMVAHHILFTRKNSEGKKEQFELASAETLLFDQGVLKACFGESWDVAGLALVLCDGTSRLQRFVDMMDGYEAKGKEYFLQR